MSDVEDAGGSAGPTPVRVNEVGTTKVACSMLSSVGFEDVVSRLKAFEERIRGDDGGEEQQLVMFTRVTGGGGSSSSSGSGSGGCCDGGSSAGSFNGGRYGAGSSNGAGGGGRSSSSGAGLSNDNGASDDGVSGSLSREMKQKWGRFNNQGEVINKDGSGGRNNGGGAGFVREGMREMKGKWVKVNNRSDVINKEGFGLGGGSGSGSYGVSGSKAKAIINPTAISPITNPISIHILMKPLARIKFKEMRSLIRIIDISRRT